MLVLLNKEGTKTALHGQKAEIKQLLEFAGSWCDYMASQTRNKQIAQHFDQQSQTYRELANKTE